jgi:hypothetical protein
MFEEKPTFSLLGKVYAETNIEKTRGNHETGACQKQKSVRGGKTQDYKLQEVTGKNEDKHERI